MSKYIELAKKLKSLSERGVGGEKENAEAQLKKLMAKHGITMDEIEGEKLERKFIKISTDQQKLFFQVAYSVRKEVRGYKCKGGYNVQMTASEFLEVQSKFDFFWKTWNEELEIIYAAFVQANKIFHPEGKTENIDEMKAEDLKKTLRIVKMAHSIGSSGYLKTLKQ